MLIEQCLCQREYAGIALPWLRLVSGGSPFYARDPAAPEEAADGVSR